jgi:hypothetical protein
LPKIKYKDIAIRKKGLDQISKINSIVDDYKQQGYDLTLRQVYYQLVSKNIIENSEKSYKNIGNLINNGRNAGLIDWLAIEDRTRYLRELTHWNNPTSIIKDAAEQYRIDLWQTQENYVEVWIEKDALIGIVEQVSARYDVPCFSCRGFVSASEMWIASQRMIKMYRNERRCIVLHLGDHDPSGIDMTRDIKDRFKLFGAAVDIKRLALNMDQVRQWADALDDFEDKCDCEECIN